eukprot:TRINITY_DN6829_c0_g1_i2.p1 TRINITY_DN6829_c0_g1~~TRINITY_DN6829_c0_g1_i2.p1  ORF type:complete len:125 (+),score=31.52 TRINITY_DN6829_c0_g1_i2:55-429(+)
MSEQGNQLIEMQKELTDTSLELNQLMRYLQLNNIEKQKGLHTMSTLDQLEPDTPTYKSAGRVFVKTPVEEIKKDLSGMLNKVDETMEKQKVRIQILEEKEKKQETALNEFAESTMAKFNSNQQN